MSIRKASLRRGTCGPPLLLLVQLYIGNLMIKNYYLLLITQNLT